MKTRMTHLLSPLVVSVALAGCSPSKTTDSSTPTPAATAREMKVEITQAVGAAKGYVTETKEQFVASTQEKLSKLDQQISELGAKAAALKDEAKSEGNKALTSLRAERAQLGQKFEEVKSANQQAWKDAKAGFEAAYAKLVKAYESARAKVGT